MTITRELPIVGRRSWTVAEFERLADIGFFAPEERLELIEGEIVEKMTQNEPHAVAVTLAQYALGPLFGADATVRVQLPMVLGQQSRPEPDLAVVSGSPRDFLQSHPSTAILIVEISDATLEYDRQVKGSLYAREGILDYWIVNLLDRVVEVHRQPARMAGASLDWGYRSIQHFGAGQTLSPLAASEHSIAVSDLLP